MKPNSKLNKSIKKKKESVRSYLRINKKKRWPASHIGSPRYNMKRPNLKEQPLSLRCLKGKNKQ